MPIDQQMVPLWHQAADTAGIRLRLLESADQLPADSALIVCDLNLMPTPALIRRAAEVTGVEAANVLPLAEPGAPACVLVGAEACSFDGPQRDADYPVNRTAIATRRCRWRDDVLTDLQVDTSTYSNTPPLTQTPFLTIVTRTQGNRPECLDEMLATLSIQTDRDFEVVLACHRISPESFTAIQDVIAGQVGWLRERIRTIQVDYGTRSAPLNAGFSAARGNYLNALDDDDLVFDHYVATFRSLAEQSPGHILRTRAIRLPVHAELDASGRPVVRADWPPRADWAAEFDLMGHLRSNRTPLMTVAYPRAIFHVCGNRFSEDRETTEDWEFLVRSAASTPVRSTGEVTSVYRWWETGPSSRRQHEDATWARDREALFDEFDKLPITLPPGSASRVRRGLEAIDTLVLRELHIQERVAEVQRLSDELQSALAERDGHAAELDNLRTRHRLLWRCWHIRRIYAQEGFAGIVRFLKSRLRRR